MTTEGLDRVHSINELIVCGWDEVFILVMSSRPEDPPTKVWSWRARDCPEFTESTKALFNTTDECKPIEGGNKILITSSGNGVALVERETKEVLFQTQVLNAHSADILPRGRLAVASSVGDGGNRLLLFDLNSPKVLFYSDEFPSAHGVVWDGDRGVLWALCWDQLRAYGLQDWDSTTPSLSRVATFELPGTSGHDLYRVASTPLLTVTVGQHVYTFDRDKSEFALHPLLGDEPHVKSLSVNPATGQIAYVQAEGKDWWAERVHFLEPKGVHDVPGEHFYKARWNT